MDIEEWRTVVIDGEQWNYEVSSYGRVRSLNYKGHGKIEIVSLSKDKDGYLTVRLEQDKRRKTVKVHRLVATMFIPNPQNKPTVNHINEDKTNNRVENLEWATHKEQVNHGSRTQKYSKRIRCVETGIIYESARQVERETGLNNANIIKCCKGKAKTCGGKHWEYVD